MHTCPSARILKLLLLLCILVPAVQAVDPLWTVPAYPGVELSTVALSHDGSTIVAGGDRLIVLSPDGTKLWSAWSGTTVDLSRDGSYIVTSQGPTVRLFTRQGTMLWDQSLGDTVTDVSISPDASMIAAGGGSYVQSWYNSGSGLGRNVTETVHDIKLSPVKDQIIVTTAKALRSFNLSYVPNWYDDSISPGIVAISGDGTGIVIPNGNHIRMYHGSGTLLWDRSFPGGNIISLAYSWDGSTIIAGRDDGTVLALDRDGNLLFTAKAGVWAMSVGVSDDGSTIATGSIDNQIRVFNRQGTLLGSYKTQSPIKSRSVAVSGDGSLIVAVDLSDVYGFSRSGFTVTVASPAPEGTGNVSAGTIPGNVTPVITLPALTSPVPYGNASVPAAGTTPSSGLSWILTLVPLAVVLLARKCGIRS
ncbi:WD40 repeat domain-containing protein [Methanoregula sp.]|jgi:WD40 repeat protein|uniref:WD40 repeat domain-containing protein n=1 Tax=Methanoregula sp. TaxID=2052170 RepID=UPI003C14BD5B